MPSFGTKVSCGGTNQLDFYFSSGGSPTMRMALNGSDGVLRCLTGR